MDKETLDVLINIQSKLMGDIGIFTSFLKMILPKNDDDRKKINILIDMMTQLSSDIDSAENLHDLKDWFYVTDLVNDWKTNVSPNLVEPYSYPVMQFINNVVELYTSGLEEDHV